VDEHALTLAFRPWSRRLLAEDALRWLVRGGIAALVATCLVLAVGWLTPYPVDQLRPIAFRLAVSLLLVSALVGAWPASRLRRAGQLDVRLGLHDRLATAWSNRAEKTPMARLQRSDALRHLGRAQPLKMRVRPLELLALGILAIASLALMVAPSPMEKVLRQMAAEQQATEQAASRVDALRQEAVVVDALTPEQAKKLDELLQRTQHDLSQARSEQAAAAVLARAQQDIQQLTDPSGDSRDQALSAMSETLSAEPLTQPLGEALQNNDPQATRQAIDEMRQNAGQLTEPQRQALSRALQRAANVGRADSRTSNALRDAAAAVASGDQADDQLQQASQSLEEAMQAAAGDASLRAASQRLHDVRTEMSQTAQGIPPQGDQPMTSEPGQSGFSPAASGTSVPIDASAARSGGSSAGSGQDDASAQQRASGGGIGGADLSQGQPASSVDPSESVFVPGRPGEGASDNANIQQPFTVRGSPRPYREVIGQYAQNGRDYVDRASVPSSVRELVRQYFSDLEGQ
jgi:hypothetical protein